MASLHDVMVYLTDGYPHKDELSNARLTKMIYLADWRAAIEQGRQITSLHWEFTHYGPWLADVIEEARRSSDFDVVESQTIYGGRKQLVRGASTTPTPDLEPWEREALDHVIAETRGLNWSEFIELVYSTYPIVRQDRYSQLDLPALAQEYEDLRRRIDQG